MITLNQMFEKQSYPKSSPSLPKSTMSASALAGRESNPGVNRGLVAPDADRRDGDASRTYDARYYRVYVHDLRFHPSHHITTLPGTIPLPAFERFPAFPATNPHHHQLQLSQTPRGERSRVCGGPEFRQFEEVFELFKSHNLSDKDGDRLFRASLRKKKEEQENEKRVLSSLNKYQPSSCVRRSQPLFPASVRGHAGDVEGGEGGGRRGGVHDL